MTKANSEQIEATISKIGLGTVQFGLDYGFTKKKTQDEVDEILAFADKNGVTLLDTARSYGDSEEKIGKFISKNSNKFVIATKLEKINYEESQNKNQLKSKVYSSLEKSLHSLNVKSIDILQLHQTEEFVLDNPILWDILAQAKFEKLIKNLGISVYEEKETIKAIESFGSLIDFIQIPYNIFDRRFEKIKEIFVEKGIKTISRSAFLKGVIACKESDLPEELFGLMPYKRALKGYADNLSMRIEELALLYVYNKNFINATILGINSVKELESNLDTIEKHQDKKIENFSDIEVKDLRLIDPRKWTSI
ncbi:MAG: aldo/keto reductase [Ignavibacteriales bacterium]